METIELEIIQNEEDSSLIEPPDSCFVNNSMPENDLSKNVTTSFSSMISYTTVCTAAVMQPLLQPSLPGMTAQCNQSQSLYEYTLGRRSSDEVVTTSAFATPPQMQGSATSLSASPLRRLQPGDRRNSVYLGPRSSMTTPDSGISSQTHVTTTSSRSSSPIVKSVGVSTLLHTCCDKSSNSSPRHFVSTLTSPIDTQSSLTAVTREHALKQEIEQLQERLKDTEERLESFRIQHDTLSQLHRKLRESNTQLQDESEMLKLDVQHLNECANVLRAELQSARNDRDEALELQNMLRSELEETRNEKKRAQEQKEKDVKTIQDLQRQCREMERILMRKHPDSVSALIVASKTTNIRTSNDQENLSSRKLLEQRIAQLEADAKEQDTKAQQILANVQARFNSVQAKYETHIADLETQVLSLQEINTKLNEKIESQVRTLDYFVSKKAERYYNNCTQTEESFASTPASIPLPQLQPALKSGSFSKPTKKVLLKTIGTQTLASTRECSTNTIGTSSQHSANSSASSTANSTPNNSRPNSKQSGLRKPVTTSGTSKLPVSQSDANISSNALQAAIHAKEDAHLLATIRGMRIDLAIKSKALQRLTRELDDCKRTIKKLQKEKDGSKCDKSYNTASTSVSILRQHQGALVPATTEGQALKEAQNRYKLLQADYRTLHEKRLQDLKTLQTAHERELASCHETVRILQQRLNERDEHIALQKRRKLPVDYYALKAKVTSLERRHTEREERLHMLVEALSKGRLNSALEDLIGDNNNQ
uniref:Centrosomal protein of 162 kDa n=1 Tax=Glossina brevipalpis TaxID=37001 RepID=A0A1A9W1H0_9MUSC